MSACHTCYVFYKTHGFHHPRKLKFEAFQHNKGTKLYITHLQCSWQMKLVVLTDNLETWKEFDHSRNALFHQETVNQEVKRPRLTARDSWDYQRLSQKSAARQIFLNDNRNTPLPFSAVNESTDRQVQLMQAIQHHLKSVDENQIKNAVKLPDDIPLCGSDWRNSEKKYLESQLDSVLLFQRGDIDMLYHMVLSKGTQCEMFKKFGQNFIGYDAKNDFMSIRFSIGLVLFCDGKNKEQQRLEFQMQRPRQLN